MTTTPAVLLQPDIMSDRPPTNIITATYTLTKADALLWLVTLPNVGVTVTLPPQGTVDWEAGDLIILQQGGTGAITISAPGVTVYNTSGLTMSDQFGILYLKRLSANVWIMSTSAGGTGVTQFDQLTDVPGSYAGQAERLARVKATEDGLEFARPVDVIAAAERRISLRAYAAGDGTDQTAGIKAALDLLTSTPSVTPFASNDQQALYVPSGRFTGDGTGYTLTPTGLSIGGDGAASQFEKVPLVIEASHITLDKMTLRGPGESVGDTPAITLRDPEPGGSRRRAQMSNMRVQEWPIGLRILGGGNDDYTNMSFLNCATSVIAVRYIGSHLTNIESQSALEYGLKNYGSGELVLNSCRFAGSGKTGIYLRGDTNKNVVENYYNRVSASGSNSNLSFTAERGVPIVSVTDNGSGKARLNFPAAQTISSVADAGMRMSGARPDAGGVRPANAFYEIRAVSSAPTCSSILSGGVELITTTITAGGTSAAAITAFLEVVAADINAGTAGHTHTARVDRYRLIILADPNDGFAANGRLVVPTFGNVTNSNALRWIEFTMSAPHGFPTGDHGTPVMVTGTSLYDGYHVATVSSSTKFVAPMAYVSTATGSLVRDYGITDGLKRTVITGTTLYDGERIGITDCSNTTEWADIDADYVGNATGTLRLRGWDLDLRAEQNNTRVNDQFFTGGNINNSKIDGGLNISFTGTRLKESVYITPNANPRLKTAQLTIIGPTRGRDDDVYTSVIPHGAAEGWGIIGCVNFGLLPDPGDDVGWGMLVPSRAGGRAKGRAARLNSVMAHHNRIELKGEGVTATLDATGLGLTTPLALASGGTGAITAIGAMDALVLKGTDIASAASVNLAAATGTFVDITGTTTITALGTLAAGNLRILRFAGALTLTHHATALILPGGANIVTAAGDMATFLSLGGGNWVCQTYSRGSALPVNANLATIAGLTPTTDNFIQSAAGAWASRTPTQAAATLVSPLMSSVWEAETLTWLKRVQALSLTAGRTEDGAQRIISVLDQYIWSLKNASIWTKFDLLYLFAMPSAGLARINLKNPGTFDLTEYNSPTFTAYEGYTGDAVSKYLGTGATYSGLTAYQQDSAHNGAWVTGGTNAANSDAKVIGPSSGSYGAVSPRGVSDLVRGFVSSTSASAFNSTATVNGHVVLNRSGASAVEAYKNGAAHGTATTASTARAGTEPCILRGSTDYADFRVAAAHWGGSLTSGEASTFYTLTLAALTALGATV